MVHLNFWLKPLIGTNRTRVENRCILKMTLERSGALIIHILQVARIFWQRNYVNRCRQAKDTIGQLLGRSGCNIFAVKRADHANRESLGIGSNSLTRYRKHITCQYHPNQQPATPVPPPKPSGGAEYVIPSHAKTCLYKQ